MFTGLIRERARVLGFDGRYLKLKARYRPKIGDSIAVNGVCLTVVAKNEDSFTVEVADETRRVVALENFKDLVHIEPAMRMGDRFEGHIVQGHVDTVGIVRSIEKGRNGTHFFIEIPPKYLSYIIPKGSVAIDGVSLTVNEVFPSGFRLTVIPHTLQNTLFSKYRVGSRVNVETDLFARYVANILEKKDAATQSGWETVEKMQALY